MPVAATLPGEVEGETALHLMGEAEARGVAVPALWPMELANALLVAVRRKRLTEVTAMEALRRLARLSVAIDAPDPAILWSGALALAFRHGLTLYDAAYLDLALRLDLPLASFDRALRAAARTEGILVIP